MAALKFPVPDSFRRGVFGGRRLVETGRTIIDHFLEAAGQDSLEGLDILDYGCGHRMAQVLAEYDLDYGSYTGIDIEPELIDHLQTRRPDARMQFLLAPFANALYRPEGETMAATSDLPVGDQRFDTAWLLSVFTHLDPDDSQALLHILHRYLRDDATLYLTAFVNRTMAVPFVDQTPDEPLMRATFSEAHLFAMLDAAGWRCDFYRQPIEIMQSQLLCRKTDDPHPPRPELIRTEHAQHYAPK